ncbi:MAG: hypothetical protein KME45_31495 [Stenomitos rutilans HA7619-LM2]|nr:hypothetical protein [Stenomitos rutilans HA7619-LM2]
MTPSKNQRARGASLTVEDSPIFWSKPDRDWTKLPTPESVIDTGPKHKRKHLAPRSSH